VGIRQLSYIKLSIWKFRQNWGGRKRKSHDEPARKKGKRRRGESEALWGSKKVDLHEKWIKGAKGMGGGKWKEESARLKGPSCHRESDGGGKKMTRR